MSIDMGKGNLPLKSKVLCFDTLTPDQKWGTLILFQSAHYQSINNGDDDDDDDISSSS